MDDRRDRGRAPWQTALAVVCVLALCLAGFIALRRVDSTAVVYDEATRQWEADVLSEVVEVGGIRCVPRRNINTFLFIGVDDTARKEENYVTGGQCDMLMLVVVDRTHGTYYKLPINRNTMCDVHSYDLNGEDLGSVVCQIALAHTSGDGGTLSCQNTADAVSDFLYGVRIDNYLALGIDAIPVVNRLAGGVTVTVEDDFTNVDPSLEVGKTVTLSDAQAVEFVRSRMDVGSGTNEERMRRQDAYFAGMLDRILEKTTNDLDFALEFYNTMTSHMVTDMNGKAFSRLIRAMLECEAQETPEITGTVGVDEFGFATFEPDPVSVRDAAIKLFYEPADEETA